MTRTLERWLFGAVTLAFAAILSTPPVVAQEEEGEEEQAETPQDRPTLQAHPFTGVIRLDGVLSEPVWQEAESTRELITIEPVEGGTPHNRTEVKVLVNPREIIIGLTCYDDDPEGIVTYAMARDIELDDEDHVVIILDTFRDGRSGYVFAINPSGSRFDGLVIDQGEDVNPAWDAIWEGAASRDGEGWYAEIRIPVQSLGFRQGLDSWGLNIERRVTRLLETSRWAGANLDYEIFLTSQTGILAGLPEFDLGVGFTFTPSLVGRTGKQAHEDRESDLDYALDITQRLGSNMLAALTVNTDFAETEVDLRQINLTRFPLFFPEKRSFFLEGSDIFDFGLGLDEENLIPFHSRRIGLVGIGEGDQAEVPINVGGKINGRLGSTNVGALVVNTRQVDGLELDEDVVIDVPRTTMGAVRLSQNIFQESSIGMLATFGDQAGRSESWSAGADFTYRTSELAGGDKILNVGAWGLINRREGLEGDRSAFGFMIDYPNELWEFSISSVRIGDGFDPSLAFVPRSGVHIWGLGGAFKPRPAWSLVRRMTHEVDFVLVNTQDNSEWESYAAEIRPLHWRFESGDNITFDMVLEGDRPPEEVEITDEVAVPEGEYEWKRYGVAFWGADKRALGGRIRYEWGDYYNGNLRTLEASVLFRPSALLTLEILAERNTGEVSILEEGSEEVVPADFIEQVYGTRIILNLSPNLQVSTLTQYDTESRELGSNNKLRWTFHPNGDVFIVYNHNLIRTLNDPRWLFESNQVPLKIQYSWRF
jgi:hypothetical protein